MRLLDAGVNRCYVCLRLQEVLCNNAGGFVNAHVLANHTGLEQVEAEVAAVLYTVLLFDAGIHFGSECSTRGLDQLGVVFSHVCIMR